MATTAEVPPQDGGAPGRIEIWTARARFGPEVVDQVMRANEGYENGMNVHIECKILLGQADYLLSTGRAQSPEEAFQLASEMYKIDVDNAVITGYRDLERQAQTNLGNRAANFMTAVLQNANHVIIGVMNGNETSVQTMQNTISEAGFSQAEIATTLDAFTNYKYETYFAENFEAGFAYRLEKIKSMDQVTLMREIEDLIRKIQKMMARIEAQLAKLGKPIEGNPLMQRLERLMNQLQVNPNAMAVAYATVIV